MRHMYQFDFAGGNPLVTECSDVVVFGASAFIIFFFCASQIRKKRSLDRITRAAVSEAPCHEKRYLQDRQISENDLTIYPLSNTCNVVSSDCIFTSYCQYTADNE